MSGRGMRLGGAGVPSRAGLVGRWRNWRGTYVKFARQPLEVARISSGAAAV